MLAWSIRLLLVCLLLVCLLSFPGLAEAQGQSRGAAAQQPAQQTAAAVAEPEAPRVVLQAETSASVLRLMKFSGALRDGAGNARSGAVGLTFALYKDQQGGSPLWLEVQNAQLDDQGRYTVLLGSTKSEGLPLELFSTGEARWLGVQLNLPGEEEQARVLLVSVPYALKAADAETLGGKPPSAFLLAEKPEDREAAGTKPGAAKEAAKEGPGRERVVGTITGEGTLNMVSKFTGANTIGNGSIFDNGSVGIGTTSPTARLHIFEPEPSLNANVRVMGSGQTGSWMDIFAGTAVGLGLFGYGAQPFIFGTNGQERVRITSTGSVGIGTTSPTARLHIFEPEPSLNANVRVMGSGQTGSWMDIFAGTAVGFGLYGYGAQPFLFGTDGQERARITATGNVGIGTTTPAAKLDVSANAGSAALSATHTANSGTAYGAYGQSASTDGRGVYGWASAGTGTTYGVYGQSASTSGTAVYGQASALSGTNYGGVFESLSTSGFGVFGFASALSGTTYGVWGQSQSTSGYGVYGLAQPNSGTNYGVYGQANGDGGLGVFGYVPASSGTTYGGFFQSDSGSGTGVFGKTTAGIGTTTGVYGQSASTTGRGVFGESTASTGVTYGGRFDNSSTSGRGVLGFATASSGTNFGVVGQTSSASGYGVYSVGNAHVQGNLTVSGSVSKGSGSFKIDHPTDPTNKYLSHSFVESPDMMNIYNGVATLDARGQAWISMPDWFEALNSDFRYQLTAIGAPGPNLYIAEKVRNRRFKIAGGKAGMEVSWQVTGIRQDAYAQAHRIPVEEEKPAAQRGYYLHPEVFGQPAERGIQWSGNKKPLRDSEEDRAGVHTTAQRPGR